MKDISFEIAQELVAADTAFNSQLNQGNPQDQPIEKRIVDIFGIKGDKPVSIKDIPVPSRVTSPKIQNPKIVQMRTIILQQLRTRQNLW